MPAAIAGRRATATATRLTVASRISRCGRRWAPAAPAAGHTGVALGAKADGGT